MIRQNRAMVIAYWSTASGRVVSKKTDLALDEWDKEITPSTELRKAFHGEVVDFATFREQYLAELAQHEQEGKRLADIAKKTAADPALLSQKHHAEPCAGAGRLAT